MICHRGHGHETWNDGRHTSRLGGRGLLPSDGCTEQQHQHHMVRRNEIHRDSCGRQATI